MFNATTVNDIISTVSTSTDGMLEDIEAVLLASLPVVLAVVGALIGLGILIRYIRRWIGRR